MEVKRRLARWDDGSDAEEEREVAFIFTAGRKRGEVTFLKKN